MSKLISLTAKVETALEALRAECSCSRDCDREREYAKQVLEEVLACSPIHLFKPFEQARRGRRPKEQ